MKKLASGIRHFVVSEDGPTAVEYALMVGLIAVAVIGTVTALGGTLNSKFNEYTTAVNSVTP